MLLHLNDGVTIAICLRSFLLHILGYGLNSGDMGKVEYLLIVISGALRVVVIVLRNGTGDTNSILVREYFFLFTLICLRKA